VWGWLAGRLRFSFCQEAKEPLRGGGPMTPNSFHTLLAWIGEQARMPFTIHRTCCAMPAATPGGISRGAIANTGRASAPSYCNLSS
jgi:hypothetical protein